MQGNTVCREHTVNKRRGESILFGILTEIGDISSFDDVKEIQKNWQHPQKDQQSALIV